MWYYSATQFDTQTWMSQVPYMYLSQGEQEEIMTMACITGALQIKGTEHLQ